MTLALQIATMFDGIAIGCLGFAFAWHLWRNR